MPKAGVFADGGGRVVAERIAARLAGWEPDVLFDGQGACWLEVGGGEAMVIRGWFLAVPGPDIELPGASPGHLEEKAGTNASGSRPGSAPSRWPYVHRRISQTSALSFGSARGTGEEAASLSP